MDLTQNLSTGAWLGLGAVLGVVAGCWDKVKAVAWRFANLFVQRVEINAWSGHHALVSYLIAKYPRTRMYDRVYGAWYEFFRDGRYGLVPCEEYGTRTLVFWNGWFPFLYANPKSDKKDGESDKEVKSAITFVRGTLDVEDLIRQACAWTNRRAWDAGEVGDASKSRFAIHQIPRTREEEEDTDGENTGMEWYREGRYRLLAHVPDELGKGRCYLGRATERLVFPPAVHDLIGELELWMASREWYQRKGLPWKRGWLLYGPPGTGKTALARACAEDLNMPIYVFNLAQMSNQDLIESWRKMQVNVPCVALLEDFDNVFHGRQNVAPRPGVGSMLFGAAKKDDDDSKPFTPLTFDCLLNCLDGVERSDGVFTIVTTNDLSKIDPALGQPRTMPNGATEWISTRPGRIDKAVELTYMTNTDKRRLAGKILEEFEPELVAVLAEIDAHPDLLETPAQFQEKCCQFALRAYWASQQPVTREERNGQSTGKSGRPSSRYRESVGAR